MTFPSYSDGIHWEHISNIHWTLIPYHQKFVANGHVWSWWWSCESSRSHYIVLRPTASSWQMEYDPPCNPTIINLVITLQYVFLTFLAMPLFYVATLLKSNSLQSLWWYGRELQGFHKDCYCLFHCKLSCCRLATSFGTHAHGPIMQYPLLYNSRHSTMLNFFT